MLFDFPTPPDPKPTIQCAALEPVSVAAAAEARRASRFADAARLASCVLQLDPADADAWFELGAAKSALDARDEARNAWLRSLDLAPANDDARLGLARLAWRDGDRLSAQRWLDAVAPERRLDSEARDLQVLLDRSRRPAVQWRFDAGAARSTLSGGLPDWTEAHASILMRQGATGFGLAVEHDRRFDREDTYIELQGTREIASTVWSLAVGGALNAQFRPESSVRFGAEHYGNRWQASGAITVSEYVVGQVDKLDIRASRDFARGLRLQVSAVAVRDENGNGQYGCGVGGVWDVTRGIALDAGWSDAPESSDGTTVDVRAVTLGATFDLSTSVHIRAGVTHEMRETYDRTEISAGLARTF